MPFKPMNLESLQDVCRIPGTVGFRPHPRQGLSSIPSLLESFFRGDGPPCALGVEDTLVVLAFDGIKFDSARLNWSPDMLLPLTSTFPSTSASAWLTAMTGLDVHQHQVPGVVYYLEEASGLFNCLSNRWLEGRTGEWIAEPPAHRVQAPAIRLGPWETIFDKLSSEGVCCIANLGDLASWPGQWADAVVHGAQCVLPKVDWNTIRFDPAEIVSAVVADVNLALAARSSTRPLLVWTFANFDDYVHRHGYDQHLQGSLREIERAIFKWTAQGVTVAAYSDHGMVRNESSAEMLEAWARINGPEYCSFPSGGAGRVRWSYPRAGKERIVLQELTGLLGEDALVVHRQELEEMGLLRMSRTMEQRVGAIVSIATGPVFPALDPELKFEHGSFTFDEMFIPFAVWEAASTRQR